MKKIQKYVEKRMQKYDQNINSQKPYPNNVLQNKSFQNKKILKKDLKTTFLRRYVFKICYEIRLQDMSKT